MRRLLRRTGSLAALLAATTTAVLAHRAFEEPASVPATPALSLLAVGDVGDPPGAFAALERQRAVGRALAHEDRRARVDALVFLGDNFYERGLAQADVAARVRENLVAPYCRFVELAGPRSAEVRDACGVDDPRPRPPLYAVLGNHDVESDESRALEAGEVPKFVSNWRLSPSAADVIELGSGVSLVQFDSNRLLREGDAGPLRDALRASRGPWRVLAAHHPIGTSRDAQGDGLGGYGERVLQAIREAGVPVHVMLAGHEHNLQLVRVQAPGPRLVVVSGAGSRPTRVRSESRSRLFKYEGLGFARLDLVRDAFGERLSVTLYGVPRWTSLVGAPPRVLARWSVVPGDGRLLREPIAVRSARLW